MTTECDEVADSLEHVMPAGNLSLDDFRREVRALMPDESSQVIDDIALALHRKRLVMSAALKLQQSWDNADAAKREIWEAAFHALFDCSLSQLIEKSRR